jgi:hypothetical protein
VFVFCSIAFRTTIHPFCHFCLQLFARSKLEAGHNGSKTKQNVLMDVLLGNMLVVLELCSSKEATQECSNACG